MDVYIRQNGTWLEYPLASQEELDKLDSLLTITSIDESLTLTDGELSVTGGDAA